jgi:hypothetical protein
MLHSGRNGVRTEDLENPRQMETIEGRLCLFCQSVWRAFVRHNRRGGLLWMSKQGVECTRTVNAYFPNFRWACLHFRNLPVVMTTTHVGSRMCMLVFSVYLACIFVCLRLSRDVTAAYSSVYLVFFRVNLMVCTPADSDSESART